MADAELQRESFAHVRPRGRWLRGLAAAVGLIVTTALVSWMTTALVLGADRDAHRALAPLPAEAPVAAVPSPAPPVPPPPPAHGGPLMLTLAPEAGADLGPCPAVAPAPDTDVGSAVAPAATGFGHGGLEGVTATATRPGWLAAWDGEHVYLSTDDGRSFAPVLWAPGRVRGAAIDCHGRVFVLRDGGLLGVRHGKRESWQVIDRFERDLTDWDWEHAPDDARGPMLAADGGLVALLGPRRGDINDGLLLASIDGGATWRSHTVDVPGSWEGAVAMNVDAGGHLHMVSAWGDCEVEGSTAHRYDPATDRLRRGAEFEDYFGYGRFTVAAAGDGWTYSAAPGCEGEVRAWTPRGAVRPLPSMRATCGECGEEPPDLVGAADHAVASFGGVVWRLDHGHAHRLGQADELERALAVDAAGRLLGLSDGRLVRWSPRHGLRFLTGQPAPESP